MGQRIGDLTFHNEATTAGTGTVYNVADYDTLVVEIYGTSTSRTVEFKVKGPSGASYPLQGSKVGDAATMATSTTGTGEMWEFEISAYTSVYMNLSAVSGGNVTIKGRVVDNGG